MLLIYIFVPRLTAPRTIKQTNYILGTRNK